MAQPAFLAHPLDAPRPSVHEPECYPLVRMRRGDRLQAVAQPLFAKRSCAFGSASGWMGRAFCRDISSRLSTRDRLEGWNTLPKRASSQKHRSARVQAATPSRPGVVCVKVRNLVVAADAVGSVGNAQRCPQGGQAASLSCSFLCSRRSSMFR